MFVKICGTTNLADAELAIELGADALGFIFAPSRRRVTAESAAEIMKHLPAHVVAVGVFTDPDVDEIARTVREAGLAAVQMHWPYDAQVIEALRREFADALVLWQVLGFAVDPADEEAAEREFVFRLRAAMHDPRLDVVLLDAVKGTASGGLGQVLPWGRVGSILRTAKISAEQAGRERGVTVPKIVLAGGLRAENVRDAVAMVQPWGVDVVSGVETEPGRKDPVRMRAFLEAARRA